MLLSLVVQLQQNLSSRISHTQEWCDLRSIKNNWHQYSTPLKWKWMINRALSRNGVNKDNSILWDMLSLERCPSYRKQIYCLYITSKWENSWNKLVNIYWIKVEQEPMGSWLESISWQHAVSADSVNSSGYCVCRLYIPVVIYITTKYFVFFLVKVLKSDVETIHICAFSWKGSKYNIIPFPFDRKGAKEEGY